MNRTNLLMILAVVAVASLFCGCQEEQVTTGFLSDYSRLKPSGTALRYLPPEALEEYLDAVSYYTKIHFSVNLVAEQC